MASYGPTIVLILKLVSLILVTEGTDEQKDKKYWHDVGRSELLASFKYKWNTDTAKNVIIFLGDGMGPDTITACRINNAGEESYLAWERFPHMGLLKTYDSSKRVPDSASTATELFSGVKTNYKVTGVDTNVRRYDCEASLKGENQVDSIFDWAQAAGKDTGFVTTSRITSATPAALYAHAADKDWECEQYMPKSAANCKDIARQLVEDQPGRDIKVIMGGGRQMLESNSVSVEGDPIDRSICYRKDGRNLLEDWDADKELRQCSHTVVQNNEELYQVDPEQTEFILGVFANGHMSMDSERNTGPEGQPSLENMTITAIKVLQKAKKGFVLVVEAGLIDVAHTSGHEAQALRETEKLSDAINATLQLVNTNETLIIVTSNHGQSVKFKGISNSDAYFHEIGGDSNCENIPRTTLGYTKEALKNMALEEQNATKPAVINKSSSEDAFTYSQEGPVTFEEATNNGIDVAIYAIGPYAHLFHTTHEQNYVAHAVAYSAEIGEYYSSHGSSPTVCSLILLVVVLPFL